MIKYEVFSAVFEDTEYGEYKSYGILARVIDGESEMLVDTLPDVSTDCELVKSLCEYCNNRKIPPFMIGGMVEDFLE